MEAYNSLKRVAIGMAGIILILMLAYVLVDNGTIPSPRLEREAKETQVAINAGSGNAEQLGLVVGDQIVDTQLKITTDYLRVGPTITVSSEAEQQSANGRFLIVHVRVENLADTPQSIDVASFYLQDGAGLSYSPDVVSTGYGAMQGLDASGMICEPGNSLILGVVFDIPPQATGLHLGYHTDFSS